MNREPGAWMVIYCLGTGAFLLGKRGAWMHKAGTWNFFGGHINPGESPEQAVLRELREETGFTPSQQEIYTLGEAGISPLGYVNGLREFHYFLMLTKTELEPLLSFEHSAYGWFKPHDIPPELNRPTAVAVEIGMLEKTLTLIEPG